jgi:N-glycosylase/DNA lyase
MKSLISQIRSLQNSPINYQIETRLKQFTSFKSHPTEKWFQELCFCILAANSKQKTAEKIETSLGYKKLLTIPQQDLANYIRENKHRFHNNKAKYIVEARKFSNIKNILAPMQELEARSWLIKNIKGLGYKESSHFLRNTGSRNLAILDRHILNTLAENKIIEKPKTLTPKLYLEIESKFNSLAQKLKISSAKLDLLVWYLRNGEIAK